MEYENSPKLSVVIPIYNVEKYLRQCLDSVIGQTLNDIEIICVNDGSKDSSLEIIQEYAEIDSRIKIVNKENSGYGDSMNKGMEAAVGDYIGIVESDDFIEPEMFETLYQIAEGNNAEVVKSNFWLYWSNPEEKNELHEYFKKNECTGKPVKPSEFDNGSLYGRKASIWSAIFKRSFLEENNIKFLPTPGASFQDTSFTFKVYSLAERMIFVYDAFLHYRQDNETSSVNSKGKAYCVCDEYKEIEEFLKKDKELWSQLQKTYCEAFYNVCTWNYERLGDELRYEFLVTVSPWLKRLVNEIGIDNLTFLGEWWKKRDIQRIIKDPMEYHTWRHVERYEQSPEKCSFPKVEYAQRNGKNNVPVFSIIIPVYNTEKYIRACLESVRYQTYKDFEVIIVNDGSTDRSLNVCAEYQRNDERFTVINQHLDFPNLKGVSAARNTGMAAANGKYIVFLDSDDWLSVTALETLQKKTEAYSSPNITVFGTEIFPREPKASDWHYEVLTTPNEYYEKMSREVILTKPYLKVYIWRCCFERDFLLQKGVRFDTESRYGEDALFLIESLCQASGVLVISDKLYNFRHFRQDSAMHTITRNRFLWARCQIGVCEKMLNFFKKSKIKPNRELAEYVLDFIYEPLNNCPEPRKYEQVVKFYKLFKNAGLHKCLSYSLDNYVGFMDWMTEYIASRKKELKQKKRERSGLYSSRVTYSEMKQYIEQITELKLKIIDIMNLLEKTETKVGDNNWHLKNMIEPQLQKADKVMGDSNWHLKNMIEPPLDKILESVVITDSVDESETESETESSNTK